jgi:L-lactate dehydrogenase complex protein LldG
MFMATIRKALRREHTAGPSLDALLPDRPNDDERLRLARIAGRDTEARQALLESFILAGRSVNLSVLVESSATAAGAAVARLAAEKSPEWGDNKSVVAWSHTLVERLGLPSRLESMGIPIHMADTRQPAAAPQPSIRHLAETAMIGVTSADYAVAETATLAMKTRPGQPRCISLLPSIHVAVIRLDQLLADVNELYTLLKWDSNERAEGLTHSMTFITGPSKTADIEATLVHGAHGPREVVVIVLTG